MPDAMKAAIIVFLDAGLNVARWLAYPVNDKTGSDKSRPRSPSAQGKSVSWAEIAAMQPARLVLVLPASLVYHTQAQVPSHDPRVIQQSIAWAVEDELATAVEVNHVAWQPVSETDHAQAVAVVSEAVIQHLLQLLSVHALQAEVITSELYCLPVADTGPVQARGEAANESSQNVTAVFAASVAGDPGVVVRQWAWHGGFVPAVAWNNSATERYGKAQPVNPDPVLAGDHGVNFLQGTYAPRREQTLNRRQWRWLGVAVLAVLASALLANGLKYWRLQQQQAQLKNLQLHTLQEAFVDASPAELADPVNAMRSRVKGLQQSRGQGSGALTSILAALASTREQVPAVRIQGLHWRDNALEVQLVAPTIDAINRFKALLSGQNLQWQVTTGTREAIADGIKSVLVIKVLP